jgi:N-methylhydantoinase A
LLAFGGNGPLFAAGIAAELGIRRVIVPPLPGVFSAFGLLVADTEHHAGRSLRTRLDRADDAGIARILGELEQSGADRLAADGFPRNRQQFRYTASARYLGQSSEIDVPLPEKAVSAATISALFGSEHELTYGFRAPADEPVELIGLSVIARGVPVRVRLPDRIAPPAATAHPARRIWFPHDRWVAVPVLDRAELGPAPRPGPLIVAEYDATCLVPRGATAALDGFGNIRLDVAATKDGGPLPAPT